MIIMREAKADDVEVLAPLIAKFRVELKKFKKIQSTININAAKTEFCEYLDSRFPIYLAFIDDECVGYIVCRVDEPCVWVESIFVLESYRKLGIASKLFERAEILAKSYGEETLYNYVHPNNDAIIRFLNSKEYNVLNLIEIRKKYKNENITTKIKIKNNIFDY